MVQGDFTALYISHRHRGTEIGRSSGITRGHHCTIHLAQVSWNGDSQAEVMVPGGFKRQLCGLCGNFNGFPQDDLRTRFGQITNSPAVFGNSWKVRIGSKKPAAMLLKKGVELN